MATLFDLKQLKVALPPGAKDIMIEFLNVKQTKDVKIEIYVGGIIRRYGTRLLLDSFKKINEDKLVVKLILVCQQKI